jgi:tetratricopeptide (TPR) repeat protein
VKSDDFDNAYKTADELAIVANDNASALNRLAWTIVDSETITRRDYDRAHKYATRAVELTDGTEAEVIDTLARVEFEQGHLDKAVEWQTKAVENAPDEEKAELQKTLDEYKAKAAAK